MKLCPRCGRGCQNKFMAMCQECMLGETPSDKCVVCGRVIYARSPADLLVAMVEHYDAHPLES